jgi:hypothetical protein
MNIEELERAINECMAILPTPIHAEYDRDDSVSYIYTKRNSNVATVTHPLPREVAALIVAAVNSLPALIAVAKAARRIVAAEAASDNAAALAAWDELNEAVTALDALNGGAR